MFSGVLHLTIMARSKSYRRKSSMQTLPLSFPGYSIAHPPEWLSLRYLPFYCRLRILTSRFYINTNHARILKVLAPAYTSP